MINMNNSEKQEGKGRRKETTDLGDQILESRETVSKIKLLYEHFDNSTTSQHYQNNFQLEVSKTKYYNRIAKALQLLFKK